MSRQTREAKKNVSIHLSTTSQFSLRQRTKSYGSSPLEGCKWRNKAEREESKRLHGNDRNFDSLMLGNSFGDWHGTYYLGTSRKLRLLPGEITRSLYGRIIGSLPISVTVVVDHCTKSHSVRFLRKQPRMDSLTTSTHKGGDEEPGGFFMILTSFLS